MSSYRQMYMVNQDQYNILQKITNPPAQVALPMDISTIPSTSSTTPIPSTTSVDKWAITGDRPIQRPSIPTGGPTFSCTICNKSFNKRLNLKYHMRIHKKPTCEIDNREFDHPNILAHHLKKQHVDGYKCNTCGEVKKSQSELNKHLASSHQPTHKKPKKAKNLLIINPVKWEKL